MRRQVGTGFAALLGLGVLVGCTTQGSPAASNGESNGDAVPRVEAPVLRPAPPEAAAVSRASSREPIAPPVAKDAGVRSVPASIKPIPPSPEPPPQAGLLTAGDYDDVLNPALYKSYVDGALQGDLGKKSLPYVDAHRRVQIAVLDRLGKPMPLARIAVTDSQGGPLFPLRTGADGRAYLYPDYDRLSEGATVLVSNPGARTIKRILSPELLASGGTLTIDMGQDASSVTQLDLLLTLDATGSMADEVTYLQAELVAILDRLRARLPALDIRVGFIVYRDKGDAYVLRDVPFTQDLDAFKTALAEQAAQGGGDMPEAMHVALEAGLKFDWRDDAVKVNLLVADAPPHDDRIDASWAVGQISRSRGIHIVSLAASGVDETAEFILRGLSQLTAGRYLFLTDDSGVGRAHAEPTVACYVVTRLDGLVGRVLETLVTGQRVEPSGEAVIRTVGNYRAGICAPETVTTG